MADELINSDRTNFNEVNREALIHTIMDNLETQLDNRIQGYLARLHGRIAEIRALLLNGNHADNGYYAKEIFNDVMEELDLDGLGTHIFNHFNNR